MKTFTDIYIFIYIYTWQQTKNCGLYSILIYQKILFCWFFNSKSTRLIEIKQIKTTAELYYCLFEFTTSITQKFFFVENSTQLLSDILSDHRKNGTTSHAQFTKRDIHTFLDGKRGLKEHENNVIKTIT